MFRRLTDWYIDRLVAKELANLPAIDWRALLGKIRDEVEGLLECQPHVVVTPDTRK